MQFSKNAALTTMFSYRLCRWFSELMYLPALPFLLLYFDATRQSLQLTQVVFQFGLLISAIFGGAVSALIGIKRSLYLVLLISTVGAVVILFSKSTNLFIFGRLIQGLGIGVAVSLGNVIIHHAYHPEPNAQVRTARIFGYIGIITAFFPNLAMIAGALLFEHVSWQAIFISLIVLYVILFFLTLKLLPSDLKYVTHGFISKLYKEFKQYDKLMHELSYRKYVLSMVLVRGGAAAYFLATVFFLKERYGFSPSMISYLLVIPVCGYSGGKYLSALMSKRLRVNTSVFLGLLLAFLAGVAMVLGLYFSGSYWYLILPPLFYFAGEGIVGPQATSMILEIFHEHSIVAQSFFVFLLILLSNITLLLVTFLKTPVALALLLLVLAAVALLYFSLGMPKTPPKPE